MRGWIRLYVFSVCPRCNSDAPGIDSCWVCNGLRSTNMEHPWPWVKTTKDNIWNNFNRWI